MNRFLRFLTDNGYRFVVLGNMGFYKDMPDDKYLKKRFKEVVGMDLNLENPRTFNEKIQWLKINDRNPLYTKLVDKYAVKEWVADRIGKEYVIPTYGVYDSFDDIDIDSLPDSFVMKCTHDSGSVILCNDKTIFDRKAARKKLNRCLKRNLYYAGREWAYKDVKPRIIVEKYMCDGKGTPPDDYKVFNFDGKVKIIQVDYDRFTDHKRNLYKTDWEIIEAEMQYKSDPRIGKGKPECLDKMLALAASLSKGIPHVRTDFYCIDERIYFGEMTFYHESGMAEFRPEDFGVEVGSWLKLPTGGGIDT